MYLLTSTYNKKSQTDPVLIINVYQTRCHGIGVGGGGSGLDVEHSATLVFLVRNSLLH